jgi:hypothetical protein
LWKQYGQVPCRSQTAETYTVSPVSGALSYLWSITGGAGISGSGTLSIADFSTATSSTVTISVAAANQCGTGAYSRKNISVNLLCRVEEEILVAGKMNLFPNPSTGKITLEFTANEDGLFTMDILDLLGKRILREEIAAKEGLNRKEINLGSFASGVYLMTLRSESGHSETVRMMME